MSLSDRLVRALSSNNNPAQGVILAGAAVVAVRLAMRAAVYAGACALLGPVPGLGVAALDIYLPTRRS